MMQSCRPNRSNERWNMRARHRTAILAALALAGVLGCSTLPTAPRHYADAASPAQSGVGSSPAGLTNPETLGASLTDVSPIGKDTTYSSGDTIVVQRMVKGDDGGKVKSGVFDVDLPPGAYFGDAMVSILVDRTSPMKCELHITPALANGFSKPVTLTVDCSRRPHLARLGIVWFNEVTRSWEEVDGCSVDTRTGLVSAPLQHFSTYAVTEVIREGKAGW